jgi:uncharacterized membrane protein (DUF485 family)
MEEGGLPGFIGGLISAAITIGVVVAFSLIILVFVLAQA